MRSERESRVSTLAVTAALGALAMYVLDPDKGRRRRAIAGDRLRSVVAGAADFLATAARDATNRLHGVRALAKRPFRRAGVPDDLVLIERVRAKLGRVVSHPHAIQVGAARGRITLSGPLLDDEMRPLLDAVRSVPGVHQIEDHLVIPARPEIVPSLQGGLRRRGLRTHPSRHWAPALRAAAAAGGGALAIYGIRRSPWAGIALAGIAWSVARRKVIPDGNAMGALAPGRAVSMQRAHTAPADGDQAR